MLLEFSRLSNFLDDSTMTFFSTDKSNSYKIELILDYDLKKLIIDKRIEYVFRVHTFHLDKKYLLFLKIALPCNVLTEKYNNYENGVNINLQRTHYKNCFIL